MSLLGISIDKSKIKERLDSPKGFVAGSTDERLLKEIGAIVLEKGVWTPKYKSRDVAEFLNWIAEERPAGPLPSLAKRLLCLKREKLARGIKDAGTAEYARTFEKSWIAEIDAIFAKAGERVECVVDFIKTKEKCPPASGAQSSNEPGSVVQGSVAPSVAPGSVTPSVAPKSVAPSSAPSSVAPGSDAPSAMGKPSVIVEDEEKEDKGAKKESEFDKLIALLTNKYNESDALTQPRISRIITHLLLKKDTANIEDLVSKVVTILEGDAELQTKITEINTLLGIIEAIAPPSDVGNFAEFKKLVEETLGSKRVVYPEIKHLLQELIYTTCGEASILDPLIDHLDNLLASFGTINAKNTRFNGIKSALDELRHILEKTVLTMEVTQKDGALDARLDLLKAELETLSEKTFPGDELSGDQKSKIAALRKQIAEMEALMEATGSPEALKAIKQLELEEEKKLLVSLIALTSDEKYISIQKKAQQFLGIIDTQLNELKRANPNIKTVNTECNKRAFEYRYVLASLKGIEEQEHAIATTAAESAHRTALSELERAKDVEIARLAAQSEQELRVRDERINSLNAELERVNGMLARLEESRGSNETKFREASAAKNTIAAELTTAKARIAALQAQLAAVGDSTRRIEELEAELASERIGREGNIASRDIQMRNLTSSAATLQSEKDSRIEKLERELDELEEEKRLRGNANRARNAETAELRSERNDKTQVIADLTQRLAAAEEELARQGRAAEDASAAAERIRTVLSAQVEELTAELEGARAREGDLSGRLPTLEASLAEATAQREGNARTITELKGRIAGIADLQRQLEEAREEARAEAEGRRGNAAAATAAAAGLEGQIEEGRAQIAALQTRIRELEAAIAGPRVPVPGSSSFGLRFGGPGRGAVASRAAAIEATALGTDASRYAASHRGRGTVLARPAAAETAHVERAEAGRALGTALRSAGAASRGGTRKHKKKTGRHTRKLK